MPTKTGEIARTFFMTKSHGHRKGWLVHEHDAFGKMLNCSRAKLITFDMVKYQQTCKYSPLSQKIEKKSFLHG